MFINRITSFYCLFLVGKIYLHQWKGNNHNSLKSTLTSSTNNLNPSHLLLSTILLILLHSPRLPYFGTQIPRQRELGPQSFPGACTHLYPRAQYGRSFPPHDDGVGVAVEEGGVGVAIHAPPHGTPVVHVIVGVHVLPLEHGALSPTVQMVEAGAEMQAPLHGRLVVQTMVGVQVEPAPQGLLFPMTQGVSATGVGVAMQAPPHGVPAVQTIVGVQVLPLEQGALLPTVQMVVAVAGAEMQAPLHGRPLVQVIVGVQVEPEPQGPLSPMTHGVSVTGVGVAMHCPNQGCP